MLAFLEERLVIVSLASSKCGITIMPNQSQQIKNKIWQQKTGNQ